jgi:dTMP kinase
MNKMSNIYLAASVSGVKPNLDNLRAIYNITSRYGKILTSHILEDNVLELEEIWIQNEIQQGRSGNICERDLNWLQNSDFMIAEISRPSLGVGAEIYYALYSAKIPVLCLHTPGFHSRMITQNTHPLLSIQEYSSQADLEKIISDFFYFPDQQGRIFSIEGGDGSGKATQTKLLVQRLKQENYPVESLDFPHDQALFGTLIREILAGKKGTLSQINPILFASLYAVNRADLREVLNYWIRKGKNIILDRYIESNWGHQASKVPEDQRLQLIKSLQEFEWNWLGLPKSFRVIYLDLPIETAEQAMQQDPNRRTLDIQESDRAYKEKVREAFLWCAQTFNNWIRINCLDHQGNRIPKKELSQIIYFTLEKEFVNKDYPLNL